MWAWDGYGPQLKSYVPDFYFLGSFSILGFVFAIASAPCDFLYLNNEYMILKKKREKKKKKKKRPLRPLTLRALYTSSH